jgi:hypothetical protein
MTVRVANNRALGGRRIPFATFVSVSRPYQRGTRSHCIHEQRRGAPVTEIGLECIPMTKSLPDVSSGGFQLRSSIPVMRILDEALARSFYLDFLGFGIDWEHRFTDDIQSPIYIQISQGASILHLNGHATEDTPVCEVRIPVDGLQQYCDFLCAKQTAFPGPETVDPRYEGRNADLNIVDPFGNHLVFWAPSGNTDT